jgi:hypothetical protein
MKKLLLLTSFVAGLAVAHADEAAFQASLTPDLAVHPSSTIINGLALDLWGENPQHSLDLGFVNGSTGASSGLSWAFFVNYADSYTGVQWSMVNFTTEESLGWQGGVVNCSLGSYTGLQTGFVNYSKQFTGLQFGAINYAEQLKGLQIGFLNIAMNNSWFEEFPSKLATGFPIVNWSF